MSGKNIHLLEEKSQRVVMLNINPVQFSFHIFHCKVRFSVSQVFKGGGEIVAELVERTPWEEDMVRGFTIW
jgi:hypothetical protein